LKKVVFSGNRIQTLSEEIKQLKLLEHLDLSSNELNILPVELCECNNLTELFLNDNSLLRLPEGIGYLPKLSKLDISTNRLSSIPFSIGYCDSLTILNANENPIIDPPMEEFSKGINSIRWYCRNRFLIVKQGMPPEMKFHSIGIMNQVTLLKPEFNEIIFQIIQSSEKDGLINLQLMGLKTIPKQLLKLKELRRLKFDFNDQLSLGNTFPIEFSTLTALSLKSCKLSNLPTNLFIFDFLTILILEGNNLEYVPEEITEIITLQTLGRITFIFKLKKFILD
jgi:Leucine-rich repeat (LRR) protein